MTVSVKYRKKPLTVFITSLKKKLTKYNFLCKTKRRKNVSLCPVPGGPFRLNKPKCTVEQESLGWHGQALLLKCSTIYVCIDKMEDTGNLRDTDKTFHFFKEIFKREVILFALLLNSEALLTSFDNF